MGSFPLQYLAPIVLGTVLVLYLFILQLERWWNRMRFKTTSKATLLGKDLRDALKWVTRSGVDEAKQTSAIDISPDEFGIEDFEAHEFPSDFHEVCCKLSSILASEGPLISVLFPRWIWNPTEYLRSLLTENKKQSKVADEMASFDEPLVRLPVSIANIREKIRRSTSSYGFEGRRLQVNICNDAGFEGAQLAVIRKAVQIMQENLQARLKFCLSIVIFATSNVLTIYAFWSTSINTPQYLAAFLGGDLISRLSSQSVVDWLIPKLDEKIGIVVWSRKARLEDELLTGASGDEHGDEEEFLPVTSWVTSYFDKYNELMELRTSGPTGSWKQKLMELLASGLGNPTS